MSIEEHLNDLKATFPSAKVLYAPEIAIALNKSPTAIRRMLDKRQIPELKAYGGRLGVTVVNFARFLDEGDSPDEDTTSAIEAPTKGKHKPKNVAGSPTKATPRLRDLIALAARQVAFWNELQASLEAISLRGQANMPQDSEQSHRRKSAPPL